MKCIVMFQYSICDMHFVLKAGLISGIFDTSRLSVRSSYSPIKIGFNLFVEIILSLCFLGSCNYCESEHEAS